MGAILHGVQVDWDLDTDPLGVGGAVLRILLATWASYLAFWEADGHAPAIEQATSTNPSPRPGS